MKTLGLDFGTKRIGVAVSYLSLAQPLTIIDNDNQIWQQLENLIKEHKIKHIVVGISENQMAKKTQMFVKELQRHFDLPVTMIDETLTSYQVHQWLRQQPAKKRNQPIDHMAAAVILQQYLDQM